MNFHDWSLIVFFGNYFVKFELNSVHFLGMNKIILRPQFIIVNSLVADIFQRKINVKIV